MELSKSRKQALIIFSILFVVFSIISSLSINKYMNRTVSASEFLSEKYRNDSIDIVTDSPRIAKNYISDILKTSTDHDYTFKMGSSSYDDDLQAYKCEYRLIKNTPNCDGQHKYIHKCAWVHVNFKSNNGDYIITPRIIKVTHAVD